MLPYSLNQLTSLKLKNCEISTKFFTNFKYMDCISKIQVLNFSYSVVDKKEFEGFITNSKLTNLKSLKLKGTNIDDLLCALISDFTVVSFRLQEIDVSETKVTSYYYLLKEWNILIIYFMFMWNGIRIDLA